MTGSDSDPKADTPEGTAYGTGEEASLGSESEPINSGSAASAASSSVAAAFSQAPFQSIPVCSYHLLVTRAPPPSHCHLA